MSAATLYNRDILRLAASLEDGEPLAPPAGHAERRSPTCGSRVTLWVTRGADGRIAQISADIASCALGQASAAILLRAAEGRQAGAIAEARQAMAAYLSGAGGEPPFADATLFGPARDYPARHPAILLPYDALLAALADGEDAA
ncbi:iron-sulfur cluster assembly scaffold protein [Novosphingopyxis sp.]|uniref:iron-sulfur cluster assembly scaffold protein n=1 Tax=Novosphingopyxis sp. TaxID=2709690 RepID=UPI003B5B1479